jgi:xanthine dehydrogenase accessory factor
MTEPDSFPEIALDWHQAGRGAVLCTVVDTWGSAPRRAGSQLVVSGAGEIAGSVSGGCVEGAVILDALDALADGRQRLLTFGVSDGDAFAVGLACGGTIRVLVEPVGSALPAAVLTDLVAARAARRAVAYVTDLETGGPRLSEDYPERQHMDRTGVEPDGRSFVAVHNPPLRLIVVGAVHIAQALVPMARACGYDATVIDPRGTFLTADRFPGAELLDDWPADAASLRLDPRSAVVLLTHDPKIDDPAIVAALRADVFYIGALGSKRTHAGRVDRLTAQGFTAAQIARIHGPVGLDIGAANPAEIAVSVLAQMTQVLRQG